MSHLDICKGLRDNLKDFRINIVITFKIAVPLQAESLQIYSADHDNLYLGEENTLYWPSTSDYTLGACRAYFHVNLNGGASAVRQFVLNFGDSETTGILSTTNFTNYTNSDAWYDLSGRRLSGKPTAKGLYINGRKKVVIP